MLSHISSALIGEILLVSACLAVGGILKGATGAGAPILAVPALVTLFDVRFAIAVMVMPNLLTNLWQAWRFRENLPIAAFTAPLVLGGMAGVGAGTWLLSAVPADRLQILVALSVLGYVTLRFARPHWKMEMRRATQLALPAGLAAGLLQGASGMSAPISLTFLNAMRMERPAFIATVSLFFTTFGAVQLVALAAAGLLSWMELLYSVLALVPIWAAMPLGVFMAKRMSSAVFDRLILGLLSVLALKLMMDAAL
jgi:uncharacterized membrane protein YfcA